MDPVAATAGSPAKMIHFACYRSKVGYRGMRPLPAATLASFNGGQWSLPFGDTTDAVLFVSLLEHSRCAFFPIFVGESNKVSRPHELMKKLPFKL